MHPHCCVVGGHESPLALPSALPLLLQCVDSFGNVTAGLSIAYPMRSLRLSPTSPFERRRVLANGRFLGRKPVAVRTAPTAPSAQPGERGRGRQRFRSAQGAARGGSARRAETAGYRREAKALGAGH
jgi:hypothetical protein